MRWRPFRLKLTVHIQNTFKMKNMQKMHKVEHAIHISHISTFVPIKHIRHIGIVHPPGALENAIHVNITPVARRFVSDFILHDKHGFGS
jgi:hypothetical protein